MPTKAWTITAILGLTVLSATAWAAVAPSSASQPVPSIEYWATSPQVTSSLHIRGDEFKIQARFSLNESIGLDRAKMLVLNGDLVKKFIQGVESAQYSPVAQNGTYTYTMTIGYLGFHSTQEFLCRNAVDSPTDLDQDCFEQPSTQGSPILSNGILTTDCFTIKSLSAGSQTSNNRPGLQCVFGLSGQMHDFRRWLFDEPAAKIAYNFYTQMTSYTIHIGLLAGTDMSSSENSSGYRSTVFYNEIQSLQARERGITKIPPMETYVVALTSDGEVKAQIEQAGDYAFKSDTNNMTADNSPGM